MNRADQPEHLHALGWRQGTLFDAILPSDTIVLGEGGRYRRDQAEHSKWVVASQDCDLVGARSAQINACLEIRPVFPVGDPPPPWGIRSRVLRLTESLCVHSDGARAMVSPAALHALGAASRYQIAPPRATALKTWLGLRYDRPAVPDALVDLAKVIADRAADRRRRPVANMLHDLLVRFDEHSSRTRFTLFAVIADDGDRETVRAWLGDVGAAVPAELGVMAGYDLGTKAETALALIENSYALDVSNVTWRGAEPTGAV